jgi:hypothetical protein
MPSTTVDVLNQIKSSTENSCPLRIHLNSLLSEERRVGDERGQVQLLLFV